jgi:hypothetical protein
MLSAKSTTAAVRRNYEVVRVNENTTTPGGWWPVLHISTRTPYYKTIAGQTAADVEQQSDRN